ncbi:hypothetical protein M5K25_015553 [Dendrobium thyrsiflorum]|uniref:Uncharacterized protein n=1 Tax=Dendrobium thyrsiflorum TaxID=117978 RepID=A0ABD0UQL3_DENTH
MEGRKSFVDEFFPINNETAKTSKYDSLGSIFPPLSTGAGKDSEWSALCRKTETEAGNSWGSTGQNQSTAKKNSKPLNFSELPESCLMSSSVYYGGRDDYIPQTSATHNSGANYTYNKHNKEDDLGNSEVATRGDWWQGSYYY